eukprot:2294943-Pleurochrysis_carterae.AAC.1
MERAPAVSPTSAMLRRMLAEREAAQIARTGGGRTLDFGAVSDGAATPPAGVGSKRTAEQAVLHPGGQPSPPAGGGTSFEGLRP